MKQLLIILGMTAFMASCKNKTADDTKVLSATQQTEYDDYLKWKAAKDQPKQKTVVYTQPAAEKTVVTPVSTVAPRKKGWSKAAKGTVIGAGTGAIAGAIINKKNRGVGAIVGGLLGAGGGYVIGNEMDKKDRRHK